MRDWSIKDVEKHWDAVADIYDGANDEKSNPHDWRFIEGIKNLVPTDKPLKVLSIWSRTGDAIPYIRSKLPKAVILNYELSSSMIGVAKKKYPHEKFFKCNMEELKEIGDAEIDYIMSPETFEHLPNPEKLLNEFSRVLKDDGRLILSLPPRIADVHQYVYEKIKGSHGEGPRKGISSWRIRKMIKKSNLRLLKHYSILIIPIGKRWMIEFGNLFGRVPLLRGLGVMQFYICAKKSTLSADSGE